MVRTGKEEDRLMQRNHGPPNELAFSNETTVNEAFTSTERGGALPVANHEQMLRVGAEI